MNVPWSTTLHLLRELFTVNGAGTLIRRGSRIDAHDGLAQIDRRRLQGLLNRPLATPWSQGPWMRAGSSKRRRAHLPGRWLPGRALVGQKPVAPYLSQVCRRARSQGDGIGARSGRCSRVTTQPSSGAHSRPIPSVRGTPNSATDWYAFPNGTSSGGDCRQKRIQPAIEYCLAARARLRRGSEALPRTIEATTAVTERCPPASLSAERPTTCGAAHQDKTIP